MKYEYKFQLETTGHLVADSIELAEKMFEKELKPFGNAAKPLSIIQIDPPLPPEPPRPSRPIPPRNKPTGGGQPGTPVIRIPVAKGSA